MTAGPDPFSTNYGSFQHETFVTSIEMTAAEMAAVYAEHLNSAGHHDGKSLPVQLDQAMRATSVFHEARHLADCFGTIAGVSLFREYFELLMRFVRASRQASTELGRDWIFTAASKPDLPSYLKIALNRLVGFHVASKVFRAPFRPILASDPDEIQQVPIAFKPPRLGFGTFPEFSAAAVRLEHATFPARQGGEPRVTALLCPIGFESLVEGNATVVQRALISMRYGIEVDRLMGLYPILPSGGTRFTEDELRAAALPYPVTDIAMSKILKKKGVTTFPRDAILQATDLCLSEARFDSVEGCGYVASSPGDDFVAIVEENWRELAEGRLQHPEAVTRRYESLRDSIEELPPDDSDLGPRDLESALTIVFCYALRQFTLPLLRERLETGHTAFTSGQRTAELHLNLSKFNNGIAGVLVNQKGITFSESMSPRVRAAWVLWAVLGDVVRQLIDTKGLFVCPKKQALVQGLQFTNLAAPSDCADEIKLGCGSIYQGRHALPQCAFSTVFKGLGVLQ